MRRVSVMEADVDPDELEVLEVEAAAAGVPLEFYFIEGWRAALFRGLRELEAWKKEREAALIAQAHREMDEREAEIVAQYRENLRRRHKRVYPEIKKGVGRITADRGGDRAERDGANGRP